MALDRVELPSSLSVTPASEPAEPSLNAEPVSRTWEIYFPTGGALRVVAENWMVALGTAFEARGMSFNMKRAAWEMLPNGAIILNDLESRQRYVVRPGASVRVTMSSSAA